MSSKQDLLDYIINEVQKKTDQDSSSLKKHMKIFDWGFFAKLFGKEKRLIREVTQVVTEYLDGISSEDGDILPLDTYLRAIGIDGYKIMMKIKEYKRV
ncbi:MAG: hypothetical protein BAJATHORv1_110020 [Candidatus Thorarchaeota archaeon]|nr:MAG: hypothetical protein BAJATHORv1_110020 [Candidatus Thorarchaeota archaeon]